MLNLSHMNALIASDGQDTPQREKEAAGVCMGSGNGAAPVPPNARNADPAWRLHFGVCCGRAVLADTKRCMMQAQKANLHAHRLSDTRFECLLKQLSN